MSGVIPDSSGFENGAPFPTCGETSSVVSFAGLSDPGLALNWGLFSWVYWALWILAFFAYEIPAVVLEKKHGTLPLTRVVRDRLMRKIVIFRLAGLLAVTWIWVHFVTPLDW